MISMISQMIPNMTDSCLSMMTKEQQRMLTMCRKMLDQMEANHLDL